MKPLDVHRLPLAGVQLVEASAGTGKTYAIATLVLRLLLQRSLKLEQILVVTFTRAATAELRQRIRKRLVDAHRAFSEPEASSDPDLRALMDASRDLAADARKLKEAIASADQASVMTIHGFCQRVLKENAFESGTPFRMELVEDARPMLRELVEDWWVGSLGEASISALDYAAENGFSLETAQSLAATAVAWPQMPLVGSEAREEPLDAALSSYHERRVRLAEMWQKAKGEVVAQLLAPGVLDGRKYQRRWLDGWLAALDELLARPGEHFDGFFEKFERFSSAALVAATKKGKAPPHHQFFDRCSELLEARERAERALGQWLEAKKLALVHWARTRLAAKKTERGLQTFDDLLRELSDVLDSERGGALRARLAMRYPAALIDEFQDTDPVQYQIFRTIYDAPATSLFLVGDPKQAIYAFRGADIFAYLRAVEDTRGQHWTMGTNWRSDPGLVQAVNYVFGSCERPFVLEGVQFHSVEPRPLSVDQLKIHGQRPAPLEILFVGSEEESGARGRLTKSDWGRERLPRWIAQDIRELLSGGACVAGAAVTAGDVAVLTASNAEANDIQRELRRWGIPSVLGGDASVLESTEAHELALVMRAFVEPGQDGSVRSALATHAMGLSAEEISRLGDEPNAWEQWVSSFACWHELWQRHGFMRAFRAMTVEQDVPGRLLTAMGGERALTNWFHLGELIHQQASTGHLGMGAILEWYQTVLSDPLVRRDVGKDAQQLRLESDASAVQISTMHRSKGLEYPIVYCPYLWQPAALSLEEKRHLRYHDSSELQQLKLDIRPASDKEESLAAARTEQLAERLRLAYVALTRARHQCRVVWGLFTDAESSPLAHLLHSGFRGRHGDSGPEKLDEAKMRRQLRELEDDSKGLVRVRELQECEGAPLRLDKASATWEGPRIFTRTLRRQWRTSSFSALVADHAAPSRAVLIGRDRDESSTGIEASLLGAVSADTPANLLGFPRGARSGELLHSVLEHCDFQQLDGSTDGGLALDALVRDQMLLHGYEPELWGQSVGECIRAVVASPLSEDGTVRLERVARGKRLSELEFTLPVPAGAGAGLTAESLGQLFAQEAICPVVKRYAQRLAGLGFMPLQGYLRGFIDLIFELDGRWYVVDYKSNDLGDTVRGYERDNLANSMEHHHYILQYHLYVLALHRYLRVRLRDYDYHRDIGGVLYLFLRGLRQESSPLAGVWADRPPLRLIEGMLALVDSSATGQGRSGGT